jgi:hypothetical protein
MPLGLEHLVVLASPCRYRSVACPTTPFVSFDGALDLLVTRATRPSQPGDCSRAPKPDTNARAGTCVRYMGKLAAAGSIRLRGARVGELVAAARRATASLPAFACASLAARFARLS